MGKIIKMEEHLANMIAAGEVVERPMGVVKELVENAIDAQATRITVKLIDGGIQSIQVIDNGVGMDQEDAVNAFQRHATSKIKNIKDLWSIQTLGFRGEALPSIASVSKVTLLTSDGNDHTRIDLEYGKMTGAQPYACPKGTDITVEGLFYKTPARLKHLKSVNTETNAIVDLMEKFAFSHPEISFALVCNQVTKMETTGQNQLAEVAYRIYGKEVAKNCVPIRFSDFDFSVDGVIVLPHVTRATKHYMTVFINGRIVHHYQIQKAIQEAYKGYISSERYPICILNIQMDYQLVDVNVHPSKWEIRLSKEKQLYDLLLKELKQCLHSNMKVMEIESKAVTRIKQPKVEITTLFETPITTPLQVQEQTIDWTLFDEPLPVDIKEEVEEKPIQQKVIVESLIPELEVIGQLHGKYILAQGEDGLYIIDQHAAQEKFNYERFKRALESQQFVMMSLIVPIVFELPMSKMMKVEEMNEQLAPIGIQFETFGTHSILCRELPNWMNNVDQTLFLQDMIDLFDQNKRYSIEEIRKEAVASLACHYSIKFNRYLTKEEMEKVIQDLRACEEPFHCPHGRPTLITISEKQLIKEFKRG
ncbi:MAG: DNA mismatch repair endonuclease MutL [Erysipelotrichaceae bacterium]|nr:DNA mismatch repair endonuclease MutL [Erysipelotrichaceae bacterium]